AADSVIVLSARVIASSIAGRASPAPRASPQPPITLNYTGCNARYTPPDTRGDDHDRQGDDALCRAEPAHHADAGDPGGAPARAYQDRHRRRQPSRHGARHPRAWQQCGVRADLPAAAGLPGGVAMAALAAARDWPGADHWPPGARLRLEPQHRR